MKTFRITLRIPENWVEDVDDLKKLLESDCNIWSVTHCEADLKIEEVKEGA